MAENIAPNWHKSTYSGNTNDACIEVADNAPSVRVRDTKDYGKGELTASPAAWSAFVHQAKTYAV
ncbi:DUF397 domain-containing protein [Streptomyces vinaceus]|uniref:DUF397 domain-containing protein n=1 Tax=Streptomyces vinaceus TaxID=1960 RepID=UPI00368672F2